MIRHAFFAWERLGGFTWRRWFQNRLRNRAISQASAISALTIAMVQTSFGRLLMAAIGGAMIHQGRGVAATPPAINLPSVTRRTDLEDKSAIEGRTDASPKNGWGMILQAGLGLDRQPESEDGKIRPDKVLCLGNGALRYNPDCYQQSGLYVYLAQRIAFPIIEGNSSYL